MRFSGRRQTKVLAPAPSLNAFIPPYAVPPGQAGKPYRDGWDMRRAVESGLNASTWVFGCVQAISSNFARLPMVMREHSWYDGVEVPDHPMLDLFNFQTSPYENAFIFRKRLSQQVLLNRQGAMIEVIKDRLGRPIALYLLPAGYTWPIPDENTFVSAFRVQMPGKAWYDIPAENVVWVREPHPIDPYAGLTPMEAAGLAIETDWYAKLYNRNFLLNDGRPGGILVVKGEIDDEDARELKSRFSGPGGGGPAGAGRVSVMESEDGADWVDTAISPRDAQHQETRMIAKDEILGAFRTPESIALANASGRTFDNADAEKDNWWLETMLPHCELISRCLDVLDPNPTLFFGYDLSRVSVLQRVENTRREHLRAEVAANVIQIDEYREETGRDPMGGQAARLQIPTANTFLYTEADPPKTAAELDNDEATALAAQPPQQALPAAGPAPAKPINHGPSAANGSGDDYPMSSAELSAGPDEVKSESPGKAEGLGGPEAKGLVGATTASEFDPWIVSRMRRAESWERTLQRMITAHFERQRTVVLQKLTSRKSRDRWTKAGERGEAKAVDPESIFDSDAWKEQLRADAEVYVTQIIADFGDEVGNALSIGFDMTDARVTEAIQGQVNRLVGVEDTTYDGIKSALAEGEALGETIDELAARVGGVFADAIGERASMIARTEVMTALNNGSLEAAYQSGVVQTKTWITAADERVCSVCGPLNDLTVRINSDFDGDDAPPAHPDCRCVVIFGTDDLTTTDIS